MSLPELPELKRKRLPAAIACPWCASLQNKVDESRPNSDSTTIRRRRRCRACGQRWTTRERVVTEVEEEPMGQVGEAHKMMMRHLDWAAAELRRLEPWLRNNRGGDEEALLYFETATLHLDNARRLAEQIDSGVVYSSKEGS